MISACLPVIGRFRSRKVAILEFSTSRVSSFLFWLILKTTWLEADMSGVFSVFPEKSLWSGFWTVLCGPSSDHSLIDLTAFSTLCITTLSIAVKSASFTLFSTAVTALSSSFLISSAIFLSLTWQWLALFSPTTDLEENC